MKNPLLIMVSNYKHERKILQNSKDMINIDRIDKNMILHSKC